jgi:hypothetical protein
MAALRLCLDRPVAFDLPEIKTLNDAVPAMGAPCGVNEIAPGNRRDVKVGGEQHVMQSRSIRRSGQPICAIASSNARF